MVLVSDRLRALLRPEDELVQVDRREFVVLLEGTHVESAAAVLRRIHDGVKGVTGAARGLAPRVRVRIGMVPVTGTQTPDDILTSLEASRAHAA